MPEEHPDQTFPDPHESFRGYRQKKPAELLKKVNRWSIKGLLLEPLATLAIYAHRLIDRTTGRAYSADELEAKILGQTGGAVTTDTLGTEPADGDAPAGKLGEYRINVANDFTAMVSGVPTLVASLELTAGDWDVHSMMLISGSAGTSVTQISAGLNTLDSELPGDYENFNHTVTLPLEGVFPVTPFPKRYTLAAPATIFFLGNLIFSGGSVSAPYAIMTARRAR